MTISAKAVNVWTWRRMLRDHSPLSASTLLTMYTIATFMDADGFCFAGQERIARGARTTARTVRRHVESAKRLGWLHVELVRVASRNSPHTSFQNNYRACVPEHIELSDRDEELRDYVLSSSGDIEEGADIAMASPSPPRLEGEDIGSRRCGHPEQEVRTNDAKVRTQLCPKNSSVFNSSVLTLQREGALGSAPASDKSDSKTRRKTKTEPALLSDVLAAQGATNQEVLREESRAEPQPISEYKRLNILEMARMGVYPIESIAKFSGLTPERVRQVIDGVAA